MEDAGLVCLAAQVRYPLGELDLVMRDGQTLVFTEVRVRTHGSFGGALASLTATKLRRVARAAQVFLQRHPQYARATCRFDVVGIDADGHVDWRRNAFTLDDLR